MAEPTYWLREPRSQDSDFSFQGFNQLNNHSAHTCCGVPGAEHTGGAITDYSSMLYLKVTVSDIELGQA